MVRERDRKPNQSRYSEPFGDVGTEIAYYARQLIDTLSGRPAPERTPTGGMPDSDRKAFFEWITLEHLVPLVDRPSEVEGDVRQRAHDSLVKLHTALPFSEAEREWLVGLYRQNPRGPEALPEMAATHEAEILINGVRRSVSGQELTERWVNWRQETGEFANQGSLDVAREALHSVHELMT